MVETKPYEETKKYAICPECGKPTSTVDHLLDKTTEIWWYCDECGAQYHLKFENGKMFIGKTDKRTDRKLVLLRHGNVALIVEGMKFSDHESNDDYFYNEHTCPTNFMRNVKMIIDLRNMNNDPHGIFEYVGTFPWDDRIDESNCSMDTVAEIFRTDLLSAPQGDPK